MCVRIGIARANRLCAASGRARPGHQAPLRHRRGARHGVPGGQQLRPPRLALVAAWRHSVTQDLATRNILVSGSLLCKVSDFGLSRDLEDETCVGRDAHDCSQLLQILPVGWRHDSDSLDAARGLLWPCLARGIDPARSQAYKFSKYSTASDVWSYGILLFEARCPHRPDLQLTPRRSGARPRCHTARRGQTSTS